MKFATVLLVATASAAAPTSTSCMTTATNCVAAKPWCCTVTDNSGTPVVTETCFTAAELTVSGGTAPASPWTATTAAVGLPSAPTTALSGTITYVWTACVDQVTAAAGAQHLAVAGAAAAAALYLA